jgi:Predicted membrane protein (DUF2157)
MSVMTAMSPPSAFGRELQTLVEQGVLSPEQADRLWQAAEHDRGGPIEPARPVTRQAATGVLDVLGYVGGALLLGAVIFVGSTLWDDLGRGEKIALALASFLVPLAGGLILERVASRRGLARALLALACVAAGFVCFTILDDEREVLISSGVVVVAALLGGLTIRSAAFYAPGWVAAMIFVQVFVADELDLTSSDAMAYAVAGGFVLVGVLMVGCGLLLGRHVAWTLAGISGLAASLTLMSFDHPYLAVGLATLLAAALFVGVVRLQLYGLAVVGCLLVLSIWPWALYQILESAFGVAVGLVAAGCVLIASAVVLARVRRRATSSTPAPPAVE